MTQSFSLHAPAEVQTALAQRVRAARITAGLKQETLAQTSGVTLASLRRFERTGEISLKHLVRLLHALRRSDELMSLLPVPPAQSIAELEARASRPSRKRGTR